MNKYYTITLTPGTTSPGPYTIYLNGNPPAVIPLLYPELTLAQNIEIEILLAGVTVEVPDNTTSIVVYNTYCGSPLSLIPPTISTYSDFCLSVSAPKKGGTNVSNTHFIYNGLDSNNKPTWIDENELNPNSTINWVGNQWLLSTTIFVCSSFFFVLVVYLLFVSIFLLRFLAISSIPESSPPTQLPFLKSGMI